MRALAVLLTLALVLAVGVGAAESLARQALDERASAALGTYLRQASGDGQGFAAVVADERGWALPDLVRGRLSGIDAVAIDGRLAGADVERVVFSAGRVDLRTGSAADVRAEVTLGEADILRLVEQGLVAGGAADATASAVRAVGPQTIQVDVRAAAVDAVVDLEVRLDGDAIVAQATGLTLAAVAVDPAVLVPQPVVLLATEQLPGGLVIDAVRVVAPSTSSGTAVVLGLSCPGACALTG